MRLPRRFLPLASLLVVTIVAVALLTLAWVPAGHVLLCGDSVHSAGLRLAPRWQPRALIPLSADLELERVEVDLADGGFGARVGLHLEADPATLRLDARRVAAAGGAEPFVGARAGEFVADLARRDPRRDPLLASFRSEAGAAIAAGLAAQGLVATGVTFEPIGDAALASLRGRIAQGLARRTDRKVIVIGLDAADWQLADPLLRQGKLPALASLVARGLRADLRATDPMLSPLLWTTAATGKPPEEHGIVDFLLVDPDTGKRVPMSSRFRKVRALWNILGDFGLRSDIVAWWATWPAETIAGTLVSDRVSYSLFAGIAAGLDAGGAGLTFPPGHLEEVRGKLVSPDQISFAEAHRFLAIDEVEFERGRELLGKPPATPPEDPVVALCRTLAAARSYHAIALDLLDRGQPDLLAVYYEGIDQIGHRFMHYVPPQMDLATPEETQAYGGAVEAYYRYQDGLLGELVRRADPGTVFLVLSDHGFRNGSDRPREFPPYVNEKPGLWHRRYGLFVLAGPGLPQGSLDTVTLLDITPTILDLLGLPRAEDMRGRSLLDQFRTGGAGGSQPSVASYEGIGERSQAPAGGAGGAVEEELLRELTALGYVGGGSPAGAGGEGSSVPAAAPAGEAVTANYHLNLASILAQQGKFEEAEREVRIALELGPSPDSYRILSELLEKQGDRDGAIGAIRQALAAGGATDHKRGPGDAGRLRLVGLLLDAGRTAEAAQETNGEFDAAEIRLTAQGLLLEKEGRREEAADLYRRALATRPVLTAALERLYRLLPPQAVPSLEPIVRRGLAENDSLAPYHNVLGVILKRGGDVDGAIAEYRRALALDPDQIDYLANLGAALMIRNDLPGALEVLERARRKDPANADVWLNLGSVHGKAGRAGESLAAFRKARELGATGPGLEIGTALAHLQLGETAEARRVLAEARQRFPQDPALRDLEATLPR